MNIELLGWATLWGFLWCQVVTHYAVSVGLHRYFAHNQFKTSVAHEVGFIILIMIACVRTPIGWIASHRMHHADTEGSLDPHDAKQIGYWKVALTTWDLHHVPIQFARDLYDNPRLVWAHENWKEFILYYWTACLLAGGFYFWWAAAFMPYVFAKIGFGMLNIFGHWNGPTDAPWMNWILGGDGYHKVHHENPKQLILGKYDLGGHLAERFWKKRL
jgi:stearoyl-CoA desaturase (delta-9 desaturase)